MKKLIVITGASSGFGAQVAKLFSQAGHPTLLLARRVQKMKDLNLENAMIEKVDVSNFEQFNNAVKKAILKYGPVDLLVNNAGVMQLGQLGTQPRSEYDTMIDVNIRGVLNGIETVINEMKKRKSGTIINVSSTAGIVVYADHAAYSATKYAVSGLTETLRQEVAPFNVRVTNLCPGAFSTELLSHTSSQEIISGYKEWQKTIGKMASPIEVAKMIKYIYDAPQELNFRQVVLHSTMQVG